MMKRLAWSVVKPLLLQWLFERALKLPAKKRAELAKRLNVPEEVVLEIEDELFHELQGEINTWKP